jgi:hypothetical protein
MGSVVGTVGDKFGLIVPGPRVPTGSTGIANGQIYVLTSIYLPAYPIVANTTFLYVAFEFGWRAFVLQLNPGVGGAGTVTVNATLDGATAQGNGNAWETLPTPTAGTGVWSNPMGSTAGQRLLRIDSGPWVAFQLAVASFNSAANAYVLFGAGG